MTTNDQKSAEMNTNGQKRQQTEMATNCRRSPYRDFRICQETFSAYPDVRFCCACILKLTRAKKAPPKTTDIPSKKRGILATLGVLRCYDLRIFEYIHLRLRRCSFTRADQCICIYANWGEFPQCRVFLRD